MVQSHQHKQAAPHKKTTQNTDIDEQPARVKDDKLDADTAEFLEEVDELLGELGTEFALTFVQQGGQ